MKKKIFLVVAMVAMLACLFAIYVSAETPSMYIEFGARFPDSDEYITVYTENAETTGNPQINFQTKKFYSDIDFTQEVDMSTATGIDFSVTKSYVNGVEGNAPNRITKPSSPFVNCTEVKWFLAGFPTVSYNNSFFQGWTGLKTFDFGNATAINDNTFEGCGLESITIPATVTSFGGSIFKDCLSLKSVKIEGNVTKFGNGSTFQGCTALETVDLGTTTSLGTNMFYGCTSLKTVTGLSNLASVSKQAFYGCTQLVNGVEFGNSLTTIGENAFYNCTAITSIEIPSSVTTINKQAFYGCTSLTTVVLGDIPYIGDSMFNGCTALSSINFPSTLTSINGAAFKNCSSLTSISLPEGITSIGNQTFMSSGITSFHVPASVTSLGYEVAEYTPITSLTFAENSNLTFIDHRAFQECKSLVGPVILPDGLEKIDYGIFNTCTSLKAVKIPDSVTTLDGNAAIFTGCTSLEFVQFPKTLTVTTTIYKSMFENCTSLKAISLPEGVTKIDYKALRNCKNLQAVYLPSTLTDLGSVSTSASDWGVFYQSPKVYLVDKPFDVFNGNELLGNDFVMPAKPEVYYMPDGLVALGNSAFQDCTNLNKFIVFPVGITSVGECGQGAFFKASSSTNPTTFVFLGDMTSIKIRQNDNASSNMSFIFVNPNDTNIESMSFIIGSANNGYQTNSYAYFCASNTVYDLTTFKATNSTVYTVSDSDYTKTVNSKEAQPHFHSPRADRTSNATCTEAAGSFTFCFCGYKLSESLVPGSEPLGHDSEGADVSIYFPTSNEIPNYFLDRIHAYVCQRCAETVEESQLGTALFSADGYSTFTEIDKSTGKTTNCISHTIRINKNNVTDFEALTGNKVNYGIVAGVGTSLGSPVTLDGEKAVPNGTAVSADMTGTDYTKLVIKVTGLTNESEVSCNAYVVLNSDATKIYYLCGNEVTKTALAKKFA